jgi:hypothetical protein
MTGLTTTQLGRVCRTFLTLAYPDGPDSIPAPKNSFLRLNGDQPLEAALNPTICQTLRTDCGSFRGYALRLGSTAYPHLKLQVVYHEGTDTWLFAVDTHDNLQLEPGHPDVGRLEKLQAANRLLKEQIERAWEREGLLTFNGLLRRELNRTSSV